LKAVQYSPEQRDIAFEWVDHWHDFSTLMFDVFLPEEHPSIALSPTSADELRYQVLRQWFAEHEAHFVPLWRDFFNCLRISAFITTGYTEDVMHGQYHGERLFSAYYLPVDLSHLATWQGLQSDATVWQPDSARIKKFVKELFYFDNLVVHFFKWLDHQVGNENQPPACNCQN